MAYGANAYLGITFQNSFGSAKTSDLTFIPFVSESLTVNFENIESASITKNFDKPDSYRGMQSIEGDIQMEVHPVLIGHFLKAWHGQSQTSGSGTVTHSFVPVQNDWQEGVCTLPPVTFVVYTGVGSAHVFYDCLVNQLTFTAAHNALYQCTASIIGGRHAYAPATQPQYLPGSFYNFDTCSLSLNGQAFDSASQLEIVLNNNLEGKATLNGKNHYSRILRGSGMRTVEISGTSLLDATNQFDKYINHETQTLTAAWTQPGSSTAANNQIALEVPRMQYSEFPEVIEGPGLTEVSFKARGLYDATKGYAVKFSMVNTQTNY